VRNGLPDNFHSDVCVGRTLLSAAAAVALAFDYKQVSNGNSAIRPVAREGVMVCGQSCRVNQFANVLQARQASKLSCKVRA
jgi:hypothetical protein